MQNLACCVPFERECASGGGHSFLSSLMCVCAQRVRTAYVLGDSQHTRAEMRAAGFQTVNTPLTEVETLMHTIARKLKR